MTNENHRRSIPDRARKRAIRAHASQYGIPYSVAARHLNEATALDASASRGRTVYPDTSDGHRRWLIAAREHRPYDLRVRDTRDAARLPVGRAEHLVGRFPSMRGEPGTGIGRLYDGSARQAVIAMLYAVVMHEREVVVPSADELAWVADLGEEAAVDGACAGVDRAARDVLDQDRWRMWTRVEAALDAQLGSADRELHWAAATLRAELASLSLLTSVDGARHTLDALLVAGDGAMAGSATSDAAPRPSHGVGHAPGTRVRILVPPHRGCTGTIVGARWSAAGPPVAYEVCPDANTDRATIAPRHLTLISDTTDRMPAHRP